MAALESLRKLGATLGGRIDLHETLGEGGMGLIGLCKDVRIGREVTKLSAQRASTPLGSGKCCSSRRPRSTRSLLE